MASTAAPVLLLAPKTSYRVDAFVAAAARLGAAVRVGSDRCHRLAEGWGVPLALDFRDPDRAVAQVLAHAREEPFAAVVPTDDAATVIASRAAAELGLAANSPAAAYRARNKAEMRAALTAHDVPCPRWRLLDSAAADHDFLCARDGLGGGPVVVKPLLMAGSRGVIRADTERELLAAVARVGRILRAPDVEPSSDPAARQLLVETYVPGREVAVEGLLGDGRLQPLAVFDKPDPLVGPFFEETLYVTPSRLEERLQQRLLAATERAARALGLSCGPIHAELRFDGDRAWVIEVAGRSIGGLCARTIELALGVSLEELILSDALGRPLPAVPAAGAASGVLMLPIPKRGLLRSVRGIDRAEKLPGIESVTITAPLDHDVVPLPEGSSYLGFVFARGDEPAAVERALRAAQAELEVDIRPNLALPAATSVPAACSRAAAASPRRRRTSRTPP